MSSSHSLTSILNELVHLQLEVPVHQLLHHLLCTKCCINLQVFYRGVVRVNNEGVWFSGSSVDFYYNFKQQPLFNVSHSSSTTTQGIKRSYRGKFLTHVPLPSHKILTHHHHHHLIPHTQYILTVSSYSYYNARESTYLSSSQTCG